MHSIFRFLFLVSLGASLLSSSTCNAQHVEFPDTLRINQIQVIGSHNSFKQSIGPKLFDIMLGMDPNARKLDYAHPSLTDQLNLGLRNLELDLFHDPDGGHYANPLGLNLVRLAGEKPLPYDPQGKMKKPGFKILHIQDIDFRSNCLTLTDALKEIRRWSDLHPHHLPVIITSNLSDQKIPLPGSAVPIPFDRMAYDALDKELLSTLGRDKMIVPDDVRGDFDTLEEAVGKSNWPTLATARGKILWVLDDMDQKRKAYLADHPSLRGRAMFVNSRPGNPEAAILIRNNPVADEQAISKLVSKGYIVRTRADAATQEARDGSYIRFEAAKRSGAQVISTDFYLADRKINENFQIRFEDGGCLRLNPVTGLESE